MDLARLGAFPPCPQVLAASELDSQQTDIDRSDEALSIVARTGPLRHAPVGDSQAPLTGHNDRDCSLSWLSHSLPPIGCGQGATGGTGGPGCRPHERPSTAMLRRECGRNYRVGRFCDRQPLVGISGERFWTEELCHPVVPRVAEPVPRQATFVLSSNGTSAMLLATAPQGFWGTCCGIPDFYLFGLHGETLDYPVGTHMRHSVIRPRKERPRTSWCRHGSATPVLHPAFLSGPPSAAASNFDRLFGGDRRP